MSQHEFSARTVQWSAPEIEAWVAETWRTLGLQVQDSTSDFFAVGGTSLAAARFIAGVEEVFGEDALPPEYLYETPTVQAVADVIAQHTTPIGTYAS